MWSHYTLAFQTESGIGVVATLRLRRDDRAGVHSPLGIVGWKCVPGSRDAGSSKWAAIPVAPVIQSFMVLPARSALSAHDFDLIGIDLDVPGPFALEHAVHLHFVLFVDWLAGHPQLMIHLDENRAGRISKLANFAADMLGDAALKSDVVIVSAIREQLLHGSDHQRGRPGLLRIGTPGNAKRAIVKFLA